MLDKQEAAKARLALHRFNWKGRIINVEIGNQNNLSQRKPIEPPPKSPNQTVESDRDHSVDSSASRSQQRAEIKPPSKSPPRKSTVTTSLST